MQNEEEFVFDHFCGTHEPQRQIEKIMRQQRFSHVVY